MSTTFDDITSAWCSCRKSCGDDFGDELEHLMDLILYTNDQRLASEMLWNWSRSRITHEFGRMAVRRAKRDKEKSLC